MNALTAQTAFSLKEISLPKAMEEKVKLQVSEFQAYEINLPAFNNYLKKHTPTDSIPIKINIGTRHSIDCRIAEYEVRAKNCMEIAIKTNETELKDRGRCDTYREINSKVAHQKVLLFASAYYFSAYFYINTEEYELVSLGSFDGTINNKNILIFYKRSKLKILEQPFNCGNANESFSVGNTTQLSTYLTESNAVRFVELAIVADFEYFDHYGQNYYVINGKIRSQIMQVNDIVYEPDFKLNFKIVDLEVWETQTKFPFSYPFVGTVLTKWDKIRAYFNPISPTNPPYADYVGKRSCIQRDAAILFTYRTGDGLAGTAIGASGRTGRKTMCGTDDDILLGAFCDDKNGFAYVVANENSWEAPAHELGHLFNALDNSGNCGIMCVGCLSQQKNRCDTSNDNRNVSRKFSDDNVTNIHAHIYGVGIVPACPPHTRGSCLLDEPLNNSPTIIGNDVICGWDTYSINTGVIGLWETDDPDLILASGSFPINASSIQISSSVQGSHIFKVTFQHNCDPVVVRYKSVWVGPPDLPQVSYSTDDACQNTNGTCQVFSVSFNTSNTRGVYSLSVPSGATGSFELGSINVYVPLGGCENVSGTAYNECGTTNFSQSFCNTSSYLKSKNDLILFPNPANTNFFINTRNKGVATIFNTLGEKMGTFLKEDYSKIEIDTRYWASGVYIVKFDSDGDSATKKIYISH